MKSKTITFCSYNPKTTEDIIEILCNLPGSRGGIMIEKDEFEPGNWKVLFCNAGVGKGKTIQEAFENALKIKYKPSNIK